MPPVRLSMIRASTSGGSSEASTEAAAQSTVPTLSSLCLKAASRTAANTEFCFMIRTSRLTFIQGAIGRDGRATAFHACPPSRLSVFHEDDLLHLREMIEPVRNQNHNFIPRIGFKVGKDLVLRLPDPARRTDRPAQAPAGDAPASAPAPAAAPDRRKGARRRCPPPSARPAPWPSPHHPARSLPAHCMASPASPQSTFASTVSFQSSGSWPR